MNDVEFFKREGLDNGPINSCKQTSHNILHYTPDLKSKKLYQFYIETRVGF